MVVQTPSDLPARLPCGGLRGSYGFYHGCLPESPLRMGEDLRYCDVTMDIGRNMYVWQRE